MLNFLSNAVNKQFLVEEITERRMVACGCLTPGRFTYSIISSVSLLSETFSSLVSDRNGFAPQWPLQTAITYHKPQSHLHY